MYVWMDGWMDVGRYVFGDARASAFCERSVRSEIRTRVLPTTPRVGVPECRGEGNGMQELCELAGIGEAGAASLVEETWLCCYIININSPLRDWGMILCKVVCPSGNGWKESYGPRRTSGSSRCSYRRRLIALTPSLFLVAVFSTPKAV